MKVGNTNAAEVMLREGYGMPIALAARRTTPTATPMPGRPSAPAEASGTTTSAAPTSNRFDFG